MTAAGYSPSRLRRLRQAFASAQRRLARGAPASEQYASLLRRLRAPLEAMQRGESLPDDLRALCRAVTTDAALIARHGAERSGSGRERETADRVIAAFRAALMASPGDPTLCHNFGGYLSYLGQWSAAADCFRAAALQDDHPAGWAALGFCYARLNRRHEASACWDLALRIATRRGEPDWSVAQLRLMRGDWARGWPDYEARTTAFTFGAYRAPTTAPKWDGVQVDRLLVYGEQGAGDLLMMLRYLPLVGQRASTVTAIAPASMLSFVRSMFPWRGLTWIAPTDPVPAHDAAVSWMSLPAAFRTTVETIPPTPFLGLIGGAIPSAIPKRIGICWHGDPRHANDHVRSMSALLAERIFEVADRTGWSLQSLQYGAGIGQGQALDGDWLETARAVASCALVITVDTSIAHMAGVLGVPTWLLLPEPAEWRWLEGRTDTPWYPGTHTLIRQSTPGDWAGVVEQVVQRLADRL